MGRDLKEQREDLLSQKIAHILNEYKFEIVESKGRRFVPADGVKILRGAVPKKRRK